VRASSEQHPLDLGNGYLTPITIYPPTLAQHITTPSLLLILTDIHVMPCHALSSIVQHWPPSLAYPHSPWHPLSLGSLGPLLFPCLLSPPLCVNHLPCPSSTHDGQKGAKVTGMRGEEKRNGGSKPGDKGMVMVKEGYVGR